MPPKRFCFRARLFRGLIALAALAVLRAGAAAQFQAPPPAAAIKSRLIANFQQDQAALLDLVHREHVVVDKDGAVDGRTLRVWYVNGHEVSETVALDARELSPAELAAEHARALQRARDAARKPPAPTGLIQFENQSYSFARLADDYVYGPAHTIAWNGRTVWVYPATPNPAVPSRSRAESVLLHSSGEVWVDAADLHVIRISLHTTAPVRYLLGVLATIHTARLDLQMERRAPGFWVPSEADFSLHATVLMLRSLDRSKQQQFFRYHEAAAARAAAR